MSMKQPKPTSWRAAAGRSAAGFLAAAAWGWALALPVAAQPADAAAQATDPGAVVRSLVDAMKANDAGRIRALFAPGASQAYGDGKPETGPAFFAWLESDIIQRKGQVDEPQITVLGNEVIVTGQYHNGRGYRAAANFLIVVDGGRIVSWQMRY